ncbi:MAG TPA: VTT domain-containing protein [Acidobacteriaceae bacterium]|jgi:membrane protein DedA with SNARE-associated domain/rhodanese-related sulfurtransferase
MGYYLIHTTYPILFVSVFARQLSLPVPAILFLLAGGAMAGSGRLSFTRIMLVAILGSLLADLVWFEAGRKCGKRVLRLLCALASDPGRCMREARTVFASRGLPLLLFAKFVPGLDGICPPMAGIVGASRAAFIVYDAAGAGLWSAAYITCGFVFARELDHVVQYISTAANALILIFGVPLLVLFVLKVIQILRMIRLLRPLQITPEILKARLDAQERLGIVDLLRFEEDPDGIAVIPGAVRLDPRELRRKKHVVVPDNLDLVLYCSSKNSFVSARVAVAMRRHGVKRVLVLSGGLAAWKALGFPLSSVIADPDAELARLGIEVTSALSYPRKKSEV